ncbi:hypothetical protein, partial [uncultured Bifidobacterium sp.]|uniref:hypothetical protein n=1 Tax=uncultured Bifidobacterium sp. TaxID=165187 RepID=UPI0025927368
DSAMPDLDGAHVDGDAIVQRGYDRSIDSSGEDPRIRTTRRGISDGQLEIGGRIDERVPRMRQCIGDDIH